jgi:hypothetical protein
VSLTFGTIWRWIHARPFYTGERSTVFIW